MAIHRNFKTLTIDSIKENLQVIEYCLSFEKEKSAAWEGDRGCFGMPAVLLMMSIIDTMGSYFRGTDSKITIDGVECPITTASDHFFILNHDRLFNLNLTLKAIKDIYTKYRSPVTHNSSLPLNTSLQMGKPIDEIFIVAAEEVQTINLVPLMRKIQDVFPQFSYYVLNCHWSENHKLTEELTQAKVNTSVPLAVQLIDTGHTKTVK